MPHRILTTLSFLFLILLGSASSARAQENFGELAKRFKQMAAELEEQGRDEEADAFRRRAMEMTQNRDDPDSDRVSEAQTQVARLKRAMDTLKSKLEQGVSDEEATHIKREYERLSVELNERNEMLESRQRRLPRDKDIREKHPREPEGRPGQRDDHDKRDVRRDGDDLHFRLEHMHRAMEHLHQSGMHEIAQRVEEHAKELERELEEREGHHAERMMHEMMERIEMLARQVEELQREVGRRKR